MTFLLKTCLLIFFSILSQAKPLSCDKMFGGAVFEHQKIEKIFQNSFADPNLFKPSSCAGNVGRLLAKLETTEDLNQFQVVFLLYEKGKSSGIPTNLRLRPQGLRGGYNIWNFHAFLYYQGKILDLHSRPDLIASKEYFSRHFLNSNESSPLDNLMIRMFPASEYFSLFEQAKIDFPNDYDQVIAKSYLKWPIDQSAPLISVAELLAFELNSNL